VARKKTPRGSGGEQLPPARISSDEWKWAMAEVKRTGKPLSVLIRNRFFASMPGYKA
jgi:hypothetical protein